MKKGSRHHAIGSSEKILFAEEEAELHVDE
jgi:hypothetical protein